MKIMAGTLLFNAKGEVLLQHRDDKPNIAHPGLWSLFGGAVDEGETVEEAVIREVWEELEYKVAEQRLWLIAEQPGVRFYIFLIPLLVPLDELVLHEGQGFGLFDPEQALQALKMSPIAKYTLKTFIAERQYQKDVAELAEKL